MNIEQGIMNDEGEVEMSASPEGCQAEALEAGLEVESQFYSLGRITTKFL